MRYLLTSLTFAVVAFPSQGDVKSPPQPTTKSTAKEPHTGKAVKLTEDGEAHPPSVWMQQKLKHSQKIFGGLVKGDFISIADAAKHLKFMSRLEDFSKARHKGYRAQLRAFQFANDEILKGAREKNIDRITLGYNQMTLSCVACHKRLRSDKIAVSKE